MDINTLVQNVSQLAQSASISLNTENFAATLRTSINGDLTILEALSIKASLSKDRAGLLVYVLTNSKIVKFEIDNEGIQSFSYYLAQFVGINRNVINKPDGGNNSQIAVEFTKGAFGLRYALGDAKIDGFFLRLEDQARKAKVVA